MVRSRGVFAAALVIALIICVPIKPQEVVPGNHDCLAAGLDGLVPRNAILIRGDAAFTAENGVTSGSGTPLDPYVIQGWSILGPDSVIFIQGTRAYFEIRNVSAHKTTGTSGAIVLLNVSHCRIVDCLLTSDKGGSYNMPPGPDLELRYSNWIEVLGVTGEGNGTTLNADNVDNVTLSHLTSSARIGGASISNARNLTIFDSELKGVGILASRDVVLQNNTFRGDVYLSSCRRIIIAGNLVTGNLIPQICADLEVSNNEIGRGFQFDDLNPFPTSLTATNNTQGGKPILIFQNEDDLLLDGVVASQIILSNCRRATVQNVLIYNTGWIGLYFYRSERAIVTRCTVATDAFFEARGIFCYGSDNITISGNFVMRSGTGAHLFSCANATVIGNNFSGVGKGIYAKASDSIHIEGNDLDIHSDFMGRHILLTELESSKVFHNNFYGMDQGNYTYPQSETAGSGSYIIWDSGNEGNYWSSYGGTDSNHDGIGDVPFGGPYGSIGVSMGVEDLYPLMNPFPVNKPPHAVLVVAYQVFWSADAGSFDASSSWDAETPAGDLEAAWDWNGDGIWDSDWNTTRAANHTYPWSCECDVVVAVRDSGGFIEVATVHVFVEPQVVDYGLLRVITNPPKEAEIFVDGTPSGTWSVERVKLEPGVHSVSFGEVIGWTKPEPQSVAISPGRHYEVTGVYQQMGNVKVITPAGTPSVTILLDGVPRNERNLTLDLPPGNYTVSWGQAANYASQNPQVVRVRPGSFTSLLTQLPQSPGSPAPDPATYGRLRVETVPAAPTIIFMDGLPMNNWGLDWVKVSPGEHLLTFKDVSGWISPAPIVVNVPSGGGVVEVKANFAPMATLRVATDPVVPVTISIDGRPSADWGVWVHVTPGYHEIAFADLPGFSTPAPFNLTLTAGESRLVTGVYNR